MSLSKEKLAEIRAKAERAFVLRNQFPVFMPESLFLLLDEIDRLTAQRDKYRSEAHLLTEERDVADSKVEKLREALERIADMEPALEWDQWRLIESAQAYARTALKETEV